MSHARPSSFFQASHLSTDTPTTSSTPPQEQSATAAAAYPPLGSPRSVFTDWPDEAEEIICYYRKMREEGNSPLLDPAKVPDDVYMGMEEDINNRRILNKWKKRRDLDDFRKFVMDYFGIVEEREEEEEEEEGLEEEEEEDDEKDLEEDEDLEDDLEEDLSDLEDLEEDKHLEEKDDLEDDWDPISDPEDFSFYNDEEHDDEEHDGEEHDDEKYNNEEHDDEEHNNEEHDDEEHDADEHDYYSDIIEGLSDYELHIRNIILYLHLRIQVEPLPWRTLRSMAKLHASLLGEIQDAYHARQQQEQQQQQQQRDRLYRSNAEPGAAEIIRQAAIATASNAESMRLLWEYRARLRAELQEACRAREVRRSLARMSEAAIVADLAALKGW
ncbi:hypothetical protein B0T13DRAFT_402098 [Neurospora crassa]|nr:hypothetical protein B0T13DRAFT_402098 [Neurospora crassa]